jgi:hypothetical protein
MPRLLAMLASGSDTFPQHGVVALETLDEGETWTELWRLRMADG